MQKIKQMIDEASNIAILSHIDEDCDAFGSSLAMQEMLRSKGKNVCYFLEKTIEKKLSFISDDYIIYSDEYKNRHFDLVVCLDSGDKSRLGKRAEILNNADKSVCIDHHYTNVGYCDENYIDADMSSASEMVFNLFEFMGYEPNDKAAAYLYCGIMGDTGCLKYGCATAKTAMAVSKLMEHGFDHAEYCRRIFDLEPVELIRLKGYIMNNIESYFDGEVSLAWVDPEILKKFGISERDTGNIVNIPRSVMGTQIAAFIKKTDEKVKISLRSNGKYNVGEIALLLGGGGHDMAAGAALGNVTVEEAKEKLLMAIGEVRDGRV